MKIEYKGKKIEFKPPYVYSFEKCKCGKEFLVERFLCGSDHTMSIYVTCKECVKIDNKEFKKKRPKSKSQETNDLIDNLE